MKYFYSAILTKTKEGYEVSFPNIKGCVTFGETLEEALLNAEDALTLTLWDMEEKGEKLPEVIPQTSIKCEKGQFVNLIAADTLEYRREYDQKAVKKTLTIPKWLDTLAQRNNLNFSSILQRALVRELGV